MREIFQKNYKYWFLVIFALYFILNIITSEFYVTIKYIPYYIDTIRWDILLISFILSVITSFLVAANFVYGYIKYKKRKSVKADMAVSGIAGIGGLTVGVCPACVGGIFPLIFSALGLTFSFIVLPFGGLELQLIIIAILSASLYHLHRR